MIVEDYMLPNTAERRVIVQDSLPRLLFVDKDSGPPKASLLVWKRALINQALERFFSRADWTSYAIDSMPPSPDWHWTVGEGDQLTSDPRDIRARLSAASGIGGRPPSGNVNVTFQVRSYEERKTSRGGLNWWLERQSAVSKTPFGEAFVKALINVLQASADEGAPLFVEQVSIILSKDRDSPIATLTPTLHSDSYYGPRETAICSLLETGWDSMGGAMYLPERRMDQLWHMRPITIDKLMNDMQDEVILKTGSGDILIYDGMIGADGIALTRNGIPHISPEIAGKSSRMSILMHRRTNGDRPHE